MNTNTRVRARAVRLLIFGIIAALLVWVYPRVLSPLRGEELAPGIIAASIVVVAVRRLTRGR